MNVRYKSQILSGTKYVVYFLFKFGNEKRISELYEKGRISFQPIQDHRDKLNDHRFDSYEGVDSVKALGPGLLTIKDPKTKEKFNINLHRASYASSFHETHGNILSLYSVTNINFGEANETFIDNKMLKFGTHALFIKNVYEFNRRLEKAFKNSDVRLHKALVDYYDPFNFEGNPTIFQKPIEYKYQSEWRVYLERFGMDRFTLEIGNLSDISQILTSEEAFDIRFIGKRDV